MASVSATKQNRHVRTSLVALIVLVSRLAVASPSVGVVVAGEPAMQNKVRAQIASWVQQHGYTLVTKALSAEASKTLANCFVIEDTTCARGVVEHQSQSDHLIYVRVDLLAGTSKERDVNLTGYFFLKEHDPVVDKRACKPCGHGALNQSAADLVAALFDASALAKARLRVSTPPGLVVMLDGTNVGLTPIEEDVTPGEHTIALVRDGKELGTTRLKAAVGDTTDVVVPLTSEPVVATTTPHAHAESHEVAPEVQPDRPSRIVPGLLIVTGLGAVAVGGVFVYYGQKTGPNDPLIYPDATKAGAVIASVGGVALITGLVWWWRGSSSNGPTASIGSGGTMIGWVGRF